MFTRKQSSSKTYSNFASLTCTALILRNNRNERNTGYCTLLPHHSHLAAAVGFANLFPRFTVTRLCSATVEISKPSCWFCCKLAVLSGSAAALVVPASALWAGTLVAALLLASLATGGAGAAAWFPDDVELAVDADAEIAASPDAIIVTPGPAGAAADPASRPAVVSVAELMLTVELLLLLCTACWAPGGAGPATTVMADAMVAIVLAEGPLLMEPSWKGCAWGADIGNEPAGHMHAQLQPPFAAAAAAAAVLFPPEPATTVTADPAGFVVDAATRASGVSVAELTEAEPLEEDVAAAFAELFPEFPPATTVTAPAAAAAAVALEFDEPEPDPATTVTAAAAAAPLVDLVELLPLPASTVTAAGAAPFALALVELVPLPPPEPACTVTAFPAGVTVGEATRASAVSFAESTGGAADDDVAAASTPGAGAPPALTVTGAGAAAALAVPLASMNDGTVEFEALPAPAVGLTPSAISVIVPGAAGAVACVSC
jgi:hypothetical protein